MEIHWLGIQSRTGFSASVIMKNFNVLMNYLTNPFQWVLKMPQFPSSKNGLHHFEAVKYLFHLVTVVFVVTLPGFYPVYVDSRQKKATLPCTVVSSFG